MIDRRTLLTAAAGVAALAPAGVEAAGRAAEKDVRELIREAGGLKGGGDEQFAMLLYPGFTALDFMGPYHFLGGLAGMGGAKVHLVTTGSDLTPVACDMGMAVQPTTTMADCPENLTLLFAPGGTTGTLAAARDPAVLAFVADRGARAKYVTSVCTGSLILGAAGLLNGRRATSHWAAVPMLTRFGAIPVRQRVVRDGDLITGAGVSAGLDFGVTLVEELRGRPAAEASVLMAEYAPEPPIVGGTLESARPEISRLLQAVMAPFAAEVAKLEMMA